MNTFKTPKGTELPFLILKGKQYLQVQHRLVWFREEHPDWCIKTTVNVAPDGNSTIARAEVYDDKGRLLATGHQYEDKQGFHDHMAKAETAAIGRAIAFCGYGTSHAQELEYDSEKVTDAPMPQKQPKMAPVEVEKKSPAPSKPSYKCELCQSDLRFSSDRAKWYCPNWKKTELGKHTIIEESRP